MTHSILAVLATKPDGLPATPLALDELGPYLLKHYGRDDVRRERHRLRDELYRDGGCDFMKSVIREQFEHPEVQEMRAKLVPHARFSNILKQIIGETSSVYQEPATRKVGGSDANQKQYDAHVEALMLDEVLDYGNRMLNLHRAVLLGPSIFRDLDGAGTMSLDVVTPANAIAVVHPNVTTRVVAWLIAVDFKSHRTDYTREPKWQLWSDHEVGYLDKDFVPIGEFRVHGLGLNPWVALTYHAEAVAGFWPGEDGADLVAAQVSIWMSGVLMLKETNSATKQEIVTGDVGTSARGTPADTNVTREYPEGVSSTVVDRSMDPTQFTKPSDHILERAAGAYGLAMGALRHDMQSADAREAMMEPLRKIRRQQIKTFRRAERVLAQIMARVLLVDAPDVAFAVEAFSVDFGEPQVLVSEMERLTIFEKKRAMGLDNTVDMYRRQNPDCRSDAEALIAIMRNIEIETSRIEMMRAQMSMSGALGGNAARADGADPGGRPPSNPPADEPAPSDDLSWVEGVINAAA